MISSSYVPKTLPSNILIRGILLLISVTCMDAISFTGAMAQSQAHSPTLKYYAIAHLISTPSLVTWAANQGANAFEGDINFDVDGNPTVFGHGGSCDCTVVSAPLCQQFPKASDACSAHSSASANLAAMAKAPGIALVVLDSKMKNVLGQKLKNRTAAGANLIQLLDASLFGNGYRGSVIISTGSTADKAYLQAAIVAAKASPNYRRMFFTFDEEYSVAWYEKMKHVGIGDVDAKPQKIVNLLAQWTNHIAYGVGSSAIFPTTFHSTIKEAAALRAQGKVGLVYIWTIDKHSSMQKYLSIGANALMTNSPNLASTAIKQQGLPLAQPGDVIPIANIPDGLEK